MRLSSPWVGGAVAGMSVMSIDYLRELAAGPLQVLLPPPTAHPRAPWITAQNSTHLVALCIPVPASLPGRVPHDRWPPLVRKLFEPFAVDSVTRPRLTLLRALGPVPRTACSYCSGTGESGAGPLARAVTLIPGVVADRHLVSRVLQAFTSDHVALEGDPSTPTAPVRLQGSNGRELALVARVRGSEGTPEAPGATERPSQPSAAPQRQGRTRTHTPEGEIDNPLVAMGELRCPDCHSLNFHRGVCYRCGFEA